MKALQGPSGRLEPEPLSKFERALAASGAGPRPARRPPRRPETSAGGRASAAAEDETPAETACGQTAPEEDQSARRSDARRKRTRVAEPRRYRRATRIEGHGDGEVRAYAPLRGLEVRARETRHRADDTMSEAAKKTPPVPSSADDAARARHARGRGRGGASRHEGGHPADACGIARIRETIWTRRIQAVPQADAETGASWEPVRDLDVFRIKTQGTSIRCRRRPSRGWTRSW